MPAAMAFKKTEAVPVKIERAVGRPGGKLFQIIMDNVFGSDHGHFPTELGATPRPIKIGIGKWKRRCIESTALLPRLAPNQKWTRENDVASPPADSVPPLPRRIVWRVQVQAASEILPERERERTGKSHSVTKKPSVVLFNRKTGGGEPWLRLQKRNRLLHRIHILQPVVGFIKKKPTTISKSRVCGRARDVHPVAERPMIHETIDQHKIISGMIVAPRFEKLQAAIIRAGLENNNRRAQ